MEEINKFLTKAMGDCWHDGNASHPCTRCGLTMSMSTGYHNITFLTWEGFGKLWTWASSELWWCRFLDSLDGPLSHYINPEKFAKAVVHYLQKK